MSPPVTKRLTISSPDTLKIVLYLSFISALFRKLTLVKFRIQNQQPAWSCVSRNQLVCSLQHFWWDLTLQYESPRPVTSCNFLFRGNSSSWSGRSILSLCVAKHAISLYMFVSEASAHPSLVSISATVWAFWLYFWRHGLWFALITLDACQEAIVEMLIDVHDYCFQLHKALCTVFSWILW